MVLVVSAGFKARHSPAERASVVPACHDKLLNFGTCWEKCQQEPFHLIFQGSTRVEPVQPVQPALQTERQTLDQLLHFGPLNSGATSGFISTASRQEAAEVYLKSGWGYFSFQRYQTCQSSWMEYSHLMLRCSYENKDVLGSVWAANSEVGRKCREKVLLVWNKVGN